MCLIPRRVRSEDLVVVKNAHTVRFGDESLFTIHFEISIAAAADVVAGRRDLKSLKPTR